MLIYSTRFRVTDALNKREFVKNIIEWNRSSRYPIDDIEEDSLSFIAGDDDRCLEVTCLEKENVIAARMHVDNNGGVWNTDIILNYGLNVLTVYVNRTVAENTVNTSARSFIPTFVTQMIRKGYADKSMGLNISDKALSVSDKEQLENAVSASDKYSLPMIYLSADSEINADKLAEKLAGLAVVVSDSENLLRDRCPEPIYVFFPHRNMEPVSFGTYPLHRDIQRLVFDYLNGRAYNKLETWEGIQSERSAQDNLELLKKYRAASEDNEVFRELFEELEAKMKAVDKQFEEISRENSRLISENARLMQDNERLREDGTPLIMRGEENDMYADEQREMIIDCLADYRAKSLVSGTRRTDIVDSVIKANPVKGSLEKYRKIIKKSLEGYKAFDTADINNALRETNIKIIEHTGHYKIALNGDHRYVCEAAATCSDKRGGLNLVSEINKIMF